MEAWTVVILMLALLTKHFICDFPLQWKYQYANKGTYGHPGGLLHVAIGGVGTIVALASVIGFHAFILWMTVIEVVIHYHMDWAKMNMNEKWGFGPMTSEKFWWLLGFDQWVHHITYVAMIVWIMIYGAYYNVRF